MIDCSVRGGKGAGRKCCSVSHVPPLHGNRALWEEFPEELVCFHGVLSQLLEGLGLLPGFGDFVSRPFVYHMSTPLQFHS